MWFVKLIVTIQGMPLKQHCFCNEKALHFSPQEAKAKISGEGTDFDHGGLVCKI
jgi:hypothetical protein